MKHPAVMMAAVIGIPDEMRTQIVKAYIVLKPEASPGRALKEQIQRFVRVRLPAHEYPREIAFVKAFPLTVNDVFCHRERDNGANITRFVFTCLKKNAVRLFLTAHHIQIRASRYSTCHALSRGDIPHKYTSSVVRNVAYYSY